jgi:hypothetical protein
VIENAHRAIILIVQSVIDQILVADASPRWQQLLRQMQRYFQPILRQM